MHRIERADWQLAYGNLAVFAIACWMTAILGSMDAVLLVG